MTNLTSTVIMQHSHIKMEDIPALAESLARLLQGQFCLWLKGDLGAGKTTLVRALLYSLGLDRKKSVTSPTYTYMTEYCIGGQWYAHLDLYRLNGVGSLEDVGIFLGREYHGIFIEWPEQVPLDHLLQPTHCLTLSYQSLTERSVILEHLR